MPSWDWVSPDWVEEPFDRDMRTADRWDRLDDDALFWSHVDRLSRDIGEAGYGRQSEREEAA